MIQDTIRKPKVAVKEIVLQPMQLLFIHDTAKIVADIGVVLNRDYGELFAFITQNNLKPGRVMGFYYSYQEPFVLDAAVEVNSIPDELSGRIQPKNIAGGPAIVVHYQGPYEKVEVAYNAITSWLKEHNRQAIGSPFEAYLNDPASVKDPYDLLTDVYQLIQ